MRNSKHKDKKMYAVQILNKTFIKNIYNYLLLFFFKYSVQSGSRSNDPFNYRVMD